jgi:hypothetical protein
MPIARLLTAVVLALSAILIAAFACNPLTPATKPETYNPKISPSDLVIEYRGGQSRDGKRVVMTLAPRTYTVVKDDDNPGIHWHVVIPRPPATPVPPAIVFLCQPPPDNSRFIEITGTVRGAVGDDTDRGSGVRFTISVDATGLVLR